MICVGNSGYKQGSQIVEQHSAGTLVGRKKDDVACKWIALRIAAAFLQHLRQGELATSGDAQACVGCGSSKRTHKELGEAVGWDRQVYDLGFTIWLYDRVPERFYKKST